MRSPHTTLALSIMLIGICWLLAACPNEGAEVTADRQTEMESVESIPEESSEQADATDQVPPEKMMWRPFIDPEMSIDEINALTEQEAKAKLDELQVPFEAHNYHESIEVDPVELTALFLQAGMPVDTVNHAGVSALQAAAYQQKKNHLLLFLEKGADVHYEDTKLHATVTDFAVASGNLEILRIVLDAGADPAGGERSRPILLDAIESGNLEMFEFVRASFPDLNVTDSIGQGTLMNACSAGSLQIARILVEEGADINQTESMGGTPISVAAFRGQWEVLDYLIEVGADPLASYRGNRNLLMEFGFHPDYPRDLAQKLVDDGIDINQQAERSGITPLINAASNGNNELVRFLLDLGADPDPMDVNGFTACDYANFTGNGDMVITFAKYGITSERELGQ